MHIHVCDMAVVVRDDGVVEEIQQHVERQRLFTHSNSYLAYVSDTKKKTVSKDLLEDENKRSRGLPDSL